MSGRRAADLVSAARPAGVSRAGVGQRPRRNSPTPPHEHATEGLSIRRAGPQLHTQGLA